MTADQITLDPPAVVRNTPHGFWRTTMGEVMIDSTDLTRLTKHTLGGTTGLDMVRVTPNGPVVPVCGCPCGHTTTEHAKERVEGYRYCHLCRKMCPTF